jgi:hypothetical protein
MISLTLNGNWHIFKRGILSVDTSILLLLQIMGPDPEPVFLNV